LPWPACRASAAAFALMLASSVALSVSRSSDAVAGRLGTEDREEYLMQNDPTYAAAGVANRLLRSGDHLLSQERQTFYFNCRVTCADADECRLAGRADRAANRAAAAPRRVYAPSPGRRRSQAVVRRFADADRVSVSHVRRATRPIASWRCDERLSFLDSASEKSYNVITLSVWRDP